MEEFLRFKKMLWKYYPQLFTTSPQSMDMLDLVDRLLECHSLEVSLQITKTVLIKIGQSKMVEFLQTLCIRSKSTLVSEQFNSTLNKCADLFNVYFFFQMRYVTI